MDRECNEADGEFLRKSFPTEDRGLRDQEARILDLASGPGIPKLLSVGDNPESGEAWLCVDRVGHLDLRLLVGREGPIPSDSLLKLAVQAAAILERLHALSIYHGDIKPANFVLDKQDRVSLVDFEKAITGEENRGELKEGFSGGTHGFSPPEAYLGAAAGPGFDLYGLGATLHFLATGFPPRLIQGGHFDPSLIYRLRPGLCDSLLLLLRALLDPDPSMRPTATEVLAELRSCKMTTPTELQVERALLGADLPTERDWQIDENTTARLEQAAHWKRRLDRVMRDMPHTPPELPPRELVQGALAFGRAVRLCMEHLPLLPSMLQRKERAQQRIPNLLRRLPGEVVQHWKHQEIHDARRLASLSLDFCQILSSLNLSGDEAPQLIVRTAEALQATLRHLQGEEGRQRQSMGRIEDAESRLDLKTATEELNRLQEELSGANRTTARVRDRLHRLRWFMARVLAGRTGINRALPLLPDDNESQKAATLLLQFFQRIETELSRVGEENESEQVYSNLSITARLLTALAEGYPKLDASEARHALRQLRNQLSLRLQALVSAMQEKLDLDPIPLRVLLRDLDECETLLELNVLVDTRERKRTEVLDDLEGIRLKVEEVQHHNEKLRNRAVEKAEQGKLTTVLYDLERLLHGLPEDENKDEFLDWDLSKELEKVKQLRDSIAGAVRRNLELGQTWIHLQDDEESSHADRMACLDQREETLLFLLEKGPRESQERYARDLSNLRWERLRHSSEEDENQLLELSDPDVRLKLVIKRLDAIRKDGPNLPQGQRLQRLRTLWEAHLREARAKIEALETQRENEARRGKRTRRIGTTLLVVVLLGAGFWFLPDLLKNERLGNTWIETVESRGLSRDILTLAEQDGLSPQLRQALRSLANCLELELSYNSSKPGTETRENRRQALQLALSTLQKDIATLPEDPARAAIEKRRSKLQSNL
jgi:serine/threonine protein kinase